MSADPMTRERAASNSGVVAGSLILAAGVVLTLDALELIAAGRVLRFWPVALVAFGASLLIQRSDAHGRFWGGVWTFLGVWLLLNTLGIVRVGFFELLLPLALVLVGLKLVTHAIRPRVDAQGTPGDDSLMAILSESKRTSIDNPFTGGRMTAVMGGCQFDLRQAVIPPGRDAVIEVFGLMSGHEIWVPSSWNVVSDVVPIMAGVEDKRLPVIVGGNAAPEVPEAPPRLILRGYIVMSGLTIKS